MPRKHKPPTPSREENTSAAPENKSGASAPKPQQFKSGREVAAAIAAKHDLAEIGGQLLTGAPELKGASVSLRMFETTMEYLFGKPSSQPHQEEAARPRLIWDVTP